MATAVIKRGSTVTQQGDAMKQAQGGLVVAREFGKLWFELFTTNEHFCAQPILDKLLYAVLIGQPAFNYAGLSPIQLRKWMKGCRPATELELKAALIRLERNRYVFTDSETHETLIRSFMRRDEVNKQPNLFISAVRSAGAVESPKLAAVLLGELGRVGVPATKGETKDRIDRALTAATERLRLLSSNLLEPFADPFPEDFPEGIGAGVSPPGKTDPFTEGFREGIAEPPVVVAVEVVGSPSVVEELKDQKSGRAKRAATKRNVPLPNDWKPTDRHAELSQQRGVDLEFEATQFRHHAEANGRTQANWNAAFSMWLNRANPRPRGSGQANGSRSWQD